MKNVVTVVYDSAACAYSRPMFCRSVMEAQRAFTQLASDPESDYSLFPQDFVMYLVGEYDTDTGVIHMLPEHKVVMTASEAKEYALRNVKKVDNLELDI